MTNTKSKAADKTEITGRDAQTCTGVLNSGKRVQFKVGDVVGCTLWYDCGDGGDISCRRYGKLERIAQGTEYGMYGTTALLVFTVDHPTKGPTQLTIAARHCEHF